MSLNLPTNRAAEIGVIGTCLDGGIETCITAFDNVPDKAFYHDDVRFLFQCLKSLVARGVQPDAIALMHEWKLLGCDIAFPLDIAASAQDESPKFMFQQRSEAVLDAYHRRAAMIAGDALARAAGDIATPLVATLAKYEQELAESHSKSPPVMEPKKSSKNLIDDLERRFNLDGKMSGFRTGFQMLDGMTDGMQLGEFWVIGARPSVGKTAIALNIAESISFHQKIPSLFVSLEMSAVALLRRLLAMNGRISASEIRRGSYTPDTFKRFTTFKGKLEESPFYILDSPGGIGIGQLCNSIRAAVRRWQVKVVFIDYLQKIRPDTKGEKRTYEIGDTTSALVEVCKRENINLCSLAQLNREKDKQCRAPVLSDLADSKSIEADADFVGLLDRPAVGDDGKPDDRLANLIVAKQRDGERGIVPLRFEGCYNRFEQKGYEPRTPHGTNGSHARGVSEALANTSTPYAD